MLGLDLHLSGWRRALCVCVCGRGGSGDLCAWPCWSSPAQLAHVSSPALPAPAYTPIIINSLLNGTALSNNASVAAAKGNNSLLPVALAVVPYTLASITSYFVAHSAQRRDEHFWHVSGCLLIAGVILALFPPLAKAAAAAGFVSLSLSLGIGAAANGPAWALVGRLCKGPEQVGFGRPCALGVARAAVWIRRLLHCRGHLVHVHVAQLLHGPTTACCCIAPRARRWSRCPCSAASASWAASSGPS